MATAIIVNSEEMGRGDSVLGSRILQTLFGKGTNIKKLETIVFYNGGVKLLAEGSSCLPALAALHENGVELVACGTCVEHFGLQEKIRVGEIGSMDGIISVLNHAKKVITL